MARLSAFLLTLLLFAGAIANPVPSEYDIVDDSQGAKLRRHDDCKNVKPKTVWVTRTKTKTTTITVPKTVFSKTTIDITTTHTDTSTQHTSVTTQLPPSTVTINTKARTTSVVTDKVSTTTTFTSTLKVTPTSTTSVTETETVTLPALRARWDHGGKCHTPTYTKTKFVTKTKTVRRTKTVTKPKTISHTVHKDEFTTVTATDTTVTLPPSTTHVTTSFTTTKVRVIHTTFLDISSTVTTTTKTRKHPTLVTVTTKVTETVTPFCNTIPAKGSFFSYLYFPDAQEWSQGPTNTLTNVPSLKECCKHCDSLSLGKCQFFSLDRKGSYPGTCNMWFKLNGPHDTITKTCPRGQVQAQLYDPASQMFEGLNGPCGTIAI